MTSKVKRTNPFVWWELRRIPFNLAFLIAAEISAQLISVFAEVGPMEEAIHPFTLMAVLIILNVLYTSGWITEISERRTHNHRLAIFKWLLYVAIGLIMIPAVLNFFPFIVRCLFF